MQVANEILDRDPSLLHRVSVAHGDRRNLDWEETYERRLAGAIFERIHRATSQRGIPLVIQSIPSESQQPYRLIEMFPFEEFDVYRKGVPFSPAKRVLDPHVGKKLLYWERSHGHWTPHSHALAGRALAKLILDERILEGARLTPAAWPWRGGGYSNR